MTRYVSFAWFGAGESRRRACVRGVRVQASLRPRQKYLSVVTNIFPAWRAGAGGLAALLRWSLTHLYLHAVLVLHEAVIDPVK